MPRRFKLICAFKEGGVCIIWLTGVWKAPNYLQVFQFYFAWTDVLGYMLEVSTPYGVQVLKTGKSVPRAWRWSWALGTQAPAILANWGSEPLLSLGCCLWLFSLVTGSLLSCFAEFFLDNFFWQKHFIIAETESPYFCFPQPVAATGANRWWPHASGVLLERFLWREYQSYPSVTAKDWHRNLSISFPE